MNTAPKLFVMQLLKIIKSIAAGLAHAVFLIVGMFSYLTLQRNTTEAHRAMIYFFCKTGGRFNDWISDLISVQRRSLQLPHKAGLLGDMGGEAGESALKQLQANGYVTFERAVSPDVCDRLTKFALNTPASIRSMDGETKSPIPKLDIYNPEHPQAVRYDYSVNDLLANRDVQIMLADASLLAIAEMYLKTRPKFDVLSMWWHTSFHSQPDSEAAQFYHFDLDRLKWLKVFIYLTDVGPQDGPHSFIEGSHAPGGIPNKLLAKGYARLSDEEVLAEYSAEKEIRFAAPRGTIIIEDTRGLHKGNPVSGNSRLILQLQLSNSLFGAVYPKNKLPAERVPELEAMIHHVGDAYEAYL